MIELLFASRNEIYWSGAFAYLDIYLWKSSTTD